MPIVRAFWCWWLSPGSLQKHHSERWRFGQVRKVCKMQEFPFCQMTILFFFLSLTKKYCLGVFRYKNQNTWWLKQKGSCYTRRKKKITNVVPNALLIRSAAVCRKTGCSVTSISDQPHYKVNLPPRGHQTVLRQVVFWFSLFHLSRWGQSQGYLRMLFWSFRRTCPSHLSRLCLIFSTTFGFWMC